MKKILLLTLLFTSIIFGQTDTLFTTSGEIISGEIKELRRGVVIIETDYSDSDFEIEWAKITAIKSTSTFIMNFSDGTRLIGTLNKNKEDESITVLTDKGEFSKQLENIVGIESLNDSFLDRLSASVGIGLNLTKANNLRQFNAQCNFGYLSQNWKSSVAYNAVYSEQDSVANTKRTDGKLSYTYFLGNDWFISLSSDFLANEEQKLKLRSTPMLGFGNYIIHTNVAYLSIGAGVSGNFEQYTDPTVDGRNDTEAFFNTELNLFDVSDLDLLTSVNVFKSFDESNRIRSDVKFDLKYDILGSDFFIKLGVTFNYDSQPIESATDKDYIVQTTFGWEL